jgi:hypothetical protein
MSKKAQTESVGRNLAEDPVSSPAEAAGDEGVLVMERFGTIRELDRSFYIEHWQ